MNEAIGFLQLDLAAVRLPIIWGNVRFVCQVPVFEGFEVVFSLNGDGMY